MIRIFFAALVAVAASLSSALAQTAPPPATAKAIFANGCFWCSESDFVKVPGVVKVLPGYIGGKTKNPTYEQVGRGDTGHTEAVEVTFDPAKVSYATLVEFYWRNTDVLDAGGQFCDRGDQYRPEIFVLSDEQKRIAEASKLKLVEGKRFAKPIIVPITQAVPSGFTIAEEYHQEYYKKNPLRYNLYRTGCGRDARLQSLWGAEAGGKSILAGAKATN